ncbi:MAG: hypothetical protein JW981_06185, partial [Anaerolineae bacterium]|nr:hypothetical protein [Anaerolineae bacterium]
MVDPANRQAEVAELLQAGITAAKAGQRVAARALLRQVVEIDPRQVVAWMWLSGLVDDPGERIACLEHVVTLDPENTRAEDALEKLQQQRMENWLQQGIAAAEVGQDARAQELLTRIIETDDGNALAWFWLGKVVSSVEEKIICFENVLTLVPGHIEAQAELDQLQSIAAQEQRYASLASEILEEDFAGRDIAAETVSDEIPEEERDNDYASEASILLGEEFVKRYTLPEWEAAPTAITDVFADEYLCPYCAEPTQPKDRRCPSCGGQLWIREKKRFAKNNSFNFILILLGEVVSIVLNIALIIFWLRTLDPQIA